MQSSSVSSKSPQRGKVISDQNLHAVVSMICKCQQFLSNHADSFYCKGTIPDRRLPDPTGRWYLSCVLPAEKLDVEQIYQNSWISATIRAGSTDNKGCLPTLRPCSLDIALRGRRQRNVLKTLIAPIPLTPRYSPTWLPQENWKS